MYINDLGEAHTTFSGAFSYALKQKHIHMNIMFWIMGKQTMFAYICLVKASYAQMVKNTRYA